MKNEPCIRLGMRISPKMRENPAESRNSRPPRVMLFTARVSQRLICCLRRDFQDCPRRLLLEVLGRRLIATVDRLCQESLLVVGPELAHVGIGLDHCVRELAVLLLTLADEHRTHDVAEMIEMEGPPRGISQ